MTATDRSERPGAQLSAPNPPGRWFEGLNGVRFIAAFVVLLHHVSFSSGTTFRDGAAAMLLARMDIGVTIFFVLSGFLLYRPFVVAQFASQLAPPTGMFWLRRVVRIFPAYWLALVVLLALGAISVGGLRGFLHALTLTHVYSRVYALEGITQAWSLATELGFYLILPALAAGARRFSNGGGDGPSRPINRQALRLLLVCAALALFSVVFRLLMETALPEPLRGWAPLSRVWTPSYLDTFASGMALAVVSAWAEHRTIVRNAMARFARRVWLWWSVSAGVFWFVSTQLELQRGLDVAGVWREILRQSLYVVVALALIVPVVWGDSRSSVGLRFLATRPMAWLGLVSYGIYLWHQGFITWSHDLFDWPQFSGNFFVMAAFTLAGSAVVAGLSHRLVEEPATQLTRARRGRRTRSTLSRPDHGPS